MFLNRQLLLCTGLVILLSSCCLCTSDGNQMDHPKGKEVICPLNFMILRKMARDSTEGHSHFESKAQCLSILNGYRLARSEYLRTNGYFLAGLVEESKACWELYSAYISNEVPGLNITKSCGYIPGLASGKCQNVKFSLDFENMIPASKLNELKSTCGQPLANSAVCSSCISSLSGTYLGGRKTKSDCDGYAVMYAAAMVNRFGPTNADTAKCLFSIIVSSNDSGDKHHVVVIAAVVAGCIVGVTGAVLGIWFGFTLPNKSLKPNRVLLHEPDLTSVSEMGLRNEKPNLVKFSYQEIKQATHDFSRNNIIGFGGYGNVYKGILSNGSEVAVKRFKNSSTLGDAMFAHEVEMIASVTHVNLVALRGYCTATGHSERPQRIIVCDLMRNGSLYDHLFSKNATRLSWPIRRKIALGTARGLAYLHQGVQTPIIHRDVKSSNILVDENFDAKLADFGLAKFRTQDGATHMSTRVAGTVGYVAPEYALYGQLTEKSDVYSFGVVLLELLSGKKALDSNTDDQKSKLLSDWAWYLVRNGDSMKVIETGMPEVGTPEQMEQYLLVALLCCHPLLHARPTMDQILKMLEAIEQHCLLNVNIDVKI